MRFIFAALAASLISPPAFASTIPRVDFTSGERVVSIGLLDANFDAAISDRLSLGVTTMVNNLSLGASGNAFSGTAGARLTYRLGDGPNGLFYGVTLSGGVMPLFNTATPGGSPSPTYEPWVQPALVMTLPVWILKLRGTLGPRLSFSGGNTWLLPNLELAVPVSEGDHEVVIGGNALIGWRSSF